MKLAAAAARRFAAAPDTAARAALLYGPNRGLIADLTGGMIAALLGPKADPFALTQLGEDELRRDPVLLLDALAAQSLLGSGPQAALVRAEGDSAADAVSQALALLESGAPASSFLIVQAGDLTPRSRIRLAFEKAERAVALACYDEEPADLAAFAHALCVENGLRLEAAAAEMLEAVLPPDRGLIRSEIEKLILFAHGSDHPLTAEDVALLLVSEDETELDAAAAAALAGREGPALAALGRIDGGGIGAMKALERRLLRLLEVRVEMDRGATQADAEKKLRPPLFWKERAAFGGQIRLWTANRLLNALDVMWKAELRAKVAGAPQDTLAAEAFRAVAAMAPTGTNR